MYAFRRKRNSAAVASIPAVASVPYIAVVAFVISALTPCVALAEKQPLWPEGKMPDAQPHQFAAMRNIADAKGFNPDDWRMPYLEWHEGGAETNGICAILISGGSYTNLCDYRLVEAWNAKLTNLGCICATLAYRVPHPEGRKFYLSAWEDGQRAVRLARAAAKKRGFDPEKIITISMSAGSHLATLLATSSLTPAYEKIDEIDDIPCHINGAVAFAPAFVLTDGLGTPNTRGGDAPDITLDDCFKFDAKTAPMCLLHGGADKYSPLGSTKIYRELRKRKIPAEVHLFPNKGHGAHGFERAVEFMRQMDWLGALEDEIPVMERFADDVPGVFYAKEDIWPEGMTPNLQENQNTPYIEWYIPSNLTTKAIQVIWSGGSYNHCKPLSFEVAPVRRFLNSKGMAVVTLCYRHPRPAEPLTKHVTAWQDEQRTIRIVRAKAAQYGLDPDRIGAMGFSAGGHLALMAATSSRTGAYPPLDEFDKFPCNVKWSIAVYPAYVLEKETGEIVKEFAFDSDTPPMLFLHGDEDGYPAMGSVTVWEQLRRMGIQSELHTLAKRSHCFQKTASPNTASFNYLDRIWNFISEKIR